MWPRTSEVALAVWLALSPFIFRHAPEHAVLWWSDMVAAFLVMTISLLSFWRRTLHVHLLNVPIALWLMAFGYFALGNPPPPGAQNEMVVGLILLMFAIIPSEATLPPAEWREASAAERGG